MDAALSGEPMIRASVVRLAPLLIACASCSGAQPEQSGAGELFRLASPAQFQRGALPGMPPPPLVVPPTTPAGGAPAVAEAGLPEVSDFLTATRTPAQGQSRFRIRGGTSPNAYSVGFALDGISNGYWILPVGAPDPNTGNLEWSAEGSFDSGIPSKLYNLRAVAFDVNGNPGIQTEKQICVASRVPDNLSGCIDAEPPQAVISLTWDRNVDLDLQVQTSDGAFVNSKTPRTAVPAGATAPDAQLDRDSNAGCVLDSIRAENLVWQKVKPQGRFGIYVNLFDACKQPAVSFTVNVYTAAPKAGGGSELALSYSKSGVLLDSQANGGAARGLFLTEVVFN